MKIQKQTDNKYKIELSNSIFDLALFMVGSALKKRMVLKVITPIIGIISLFFGLFMYFIPLGFSFEKLAFPVLVIGFFLVIASMFSSDYFVIELGEDKASEEVEKAKETYEKDSKNPYAYLELDTTKLKEYYTTNQNQARNSFNWAVFAMFCGIATVLLGIWLFYLGKITEKDEFLTTISTVTGIVINLLSGSYFYLHNKTQRRTLFYYKQLIRNQQIGLLIRLSDSHTEQSEIKDSKNKIINDLLEIIKLQSIKDNEAINKVLRDDK